jgi:hypothetical protein
MAALNDDIKLFIVQALACFDSPSKVVDQVKQEFGIEVTRQQVNAYDPATVAGKRMSSKLKAIFEATRMDFLENIPKIPIANQAVRLRTLNRMLDKVERQGNVPAATAILEQAAKEVGGAFTNRREHTGANGGPIRSTSTSVDLSDLTDEELDVLERIAARREPGASSS